MSLARIRRATRLVEQRTAMVGRIEIEIGQRMREAAQSEAEVRAAREVWEAAASATQGPVCSSAELSESHAYRMALMRQVEILSARATKHRLDEEAAREKLRAAKIELRKIEIWRDRLVETIRAEEAAKERKAADDIAARIARTA